MVWTCGTHQRCSQDRLWHTGWWKAWAWEAQDDMETADREGLQSGSSRPSALMIDIPGDLVWDLPCVQQASYLEGGPLVWLLPLYLHVNQKSDYDDMISTCTNLILFLREKVYEEICYNSKRDQDLIKLPSMTPTGTCTFRIIDFLSWCSSWRQNLQRFAKIFYL